MYWRSPLRSYPGVVQLLTLGEDIPEESTDLLEEFKVNDYKPTSDDDRLLPPEVGTYLILDCQEFFIAQELYMKRLLGLSNLLERQEPATHAQRKLVQRLKSR